MKQNYRNEPYAPDTIRYMEYGYDASHFIKQLEALLLIQFDKEKPANFFIQMYETLTIVRTFPWPKFDNSRIVLMKDAKPLHKSEITSMN